MLHLQPRTLTLLYTCTIHTHTLSRARFSPPPQFADSLTPTGRASKFKAFLQNVKTKASRKSSGTFAANPLTITGRGGASLSQIGKGGVWAQWRTNGVIGSRFGRPYAHAQ